jgi:hypothetical protein
MGRMGFDPTEDTNTVGEDKLEETEDCYDQSFF